MDPVASFIAINDWLQSRSIPAHVSVTEPLQAGDLLIVLGKGEKLDLFEEWLPTVVDDDV